MQIFTLLKWQQEAALFITAVPGMARVQITVQTQDVLWCYTQCLVKYSINADGDDIGDGITIGETGLDGLI